MDYRSIAEDLRQEARKIGASKRRSKILHMAEHFDAMATEFDRSGLARRLDAGMAFLKAD